MYGTSMCENREIPLSPRLLITGWAAQGTQGGTPEMHERGKSDRFVVPANPPNKATAAEVGEERERAKGNTDGKTHPGPSAGTDASNALGRVREVARRDKDARFSALLHHVTASRLRQAYWAISPKAAPGVDWVTWDDYGRNLEANLLDLHGRVQSGRYRAKPSRRAYIPKPDGRMRPLGIASLEDKIVQRAVVEVLNAVYEVDFRGFSYGFRPGRKPHDALDALSVGITHRRGHWVLDADIRDFFGQLEHAWLRRFLRHRSADERVLRLIDKWLTVGVVEDGQWTECEEGSPQGASVSPLLANIYLHYVLDLWVAWWRDHHAHGDVIIVRWADDFVVGFEDEQDARQFLAELRGRFAKFGLELHPDKTRLIEFGRHAAWKRRRRGAGKPETFDFLGFTHICATNRARRFWMRRITIIKRKRAKLAEIKVELKRRWQHPIPEQGQWLASVLRGHYAYYAVPGNSDAVNDLRFQAIKLWRKRLRRRSQRARLSWVRMTRIANRWLPRPRVMHPFPEVRFAA